MKKRIVLLIIGLILSVFMVSCASQPSKEEVLSTVKQIPNFQKSVCYFSAGDSNGEADSMSIRSLEIGNVSFQKKLDVGNVVIYKGTDNGTYLVLLNYKKPPGIILIQKIE